ncbi:MAG: hypothetical protein PHH91_01225 [Desulfuromonadaceae bacterium]|nr:hypothetical protein [Desulfuromonadaceae bacterium]
MTEAIADGIREVPGCETVIKRVPETLSEVVLGKMGTLDALKNMAHIPVVEVDDLASVLQLFSAHIIGRSSPNFVGILGDNLPGEEFYI